jgi:hypothetical protein
MTNIPLREGFIELPGTFASINHYCQQTLRKLNANIGPTHPNDTLLSAYKTQAICSLKKGGPKQLLDDHKKGLLLRPGVGPSAHDLQLVDWLQSHGDSIVLSLLEEWFHTHS